MDTHEYLQSIKLEDKLPDFAKRQEWYWAHIAFEMKNLYDNKPCGWQDRYINPAPWTLKSRTRRWSKVGWFYTSYNLQEPIILCEWEKDWLTAWQLWWNVIWMQWVNNLNKTVDILRNKWVKKIIILVDTDDAADQAILKVQNRIICYDGRYVLWNVKDVNDARCAWILKEPEALAAQNLYVKLWAYKIKKTYRPLPDKTIDFLSIDTAMVLQDLYPQYTVKWDRIYDQWKLLDWYRYRKNQNAVVDFAGKDRPQWNAWSVAYTYYNDKKQTAEYLKKYL